MHDAHLQLGSGTVIANDHDQIIKLKHSERIPVRMDDSIITDSMAPCTSQDDRI